MEMVARDLDSGILGISLAGRMDIIGTQQIDLKLTALTSTRKAQVLVDLSNVTFLASIGIRTLVNIAKAQKLRFSLRGVFDGLRGRMGRLDLR